VMAAACTPPHPHAPEPRGNDCVVVNDSARSRVTIGIVDVGSVDDPVIGPQIHETLVRVDCDDQTIPGLAVSWSSENGREWRFGIRRGGRFSDGAQVSAQSIAAAIPALPILAGLTAQGEHDLRVLLDRPA